MNYNMINTKKTIGLFLLLFLIIISFSLVVFQKRKAKQKSVKPSSPSQITQSPLSPTVEEKRINLSQSNKGQLFLKKENDTSTRTNQNFNIILKADIANEDVVGFDIVFSFDKESLDFLSAQSLLDDFTLIPVKKENYIRLTMAKKPQAQQSTFLKDRAVISLTFKAKKTGSSTIKVLPQIDNEKTQFINKKTEIIYPAIDEIKIDVSR